MAPVLNPFIDRVHTLPHESQLIPLGSAIISALSLFLLLLPPSPSFLSASPPFFLSLSLVPSSLASALSGPILPLPRVRGPFPKVVL